MPIPFLPQGLCPCCSVCLEPPPQTLGLVISLPSGLSSHVTFLGRPSWSILAKGGFYSLSDFFFVRGFLVYFHQSTFQNMNVCLLICLYIFLPFVSKHHSLPPPHKLGACLLCLILTQHDTSGRFLNTQIRQAPPVLPALYFLGYVVSFYLPNNPMEVDFIPMLPVKKPS